MEWLLYASAALVAAAFLLLSVYIARTLIVLQETLRRLAAAVSHADEQVQTVAKEVTQLLHTANSIAGDVQNKAEKLNHAVEAVNEIGGTVRSLNRALRQTAAALSARAGQGQEKWAKALRWANVLLDIWEKWREREQLRKKEGVPNGEK
ncbi:general stress protein [Geobacillus subterraneus]|uniref:General stress protein n=2 Tax=Geobacillus TaxID=129337 RepID=A0ABM6A8Q1_9BACL|nr:MULTISPECIES: DUF948 domain-containing protein [Geobacillus]AMX82575.1 general stress protein [Geobacillus subterraneus]KZS26972.1 general stress protein [Geobacillus subterraneus]OXB90662.1 general stress protein [Geobacillus uzenensis]QIZ68703.1 DUF948 domain-containing protein [Geobacillus subterraneus]WPZ17728.1 DUF948 domain-containing protein [Geobacillus subterraneus]